MARVFELTVNSNRRPVDATSDQQLLGVLREKVRTDRL